MKAISLGFHLPSFLSRAKGYAFGLLAASSFGFIPLFSIPALQAGMNTSSVVVYRMFGSALLMALLALSKGHSLRIPLRQVGTMALLAFFYSLSSLFLLESYLYLPSGVGTTIHFLYPVFVTVVSALLFRQKLSTSALLSALLSLAGVALLSASTLGSLLDAGAEHGKALVGIGLVLITVLGYGSYLILYGRSRVKQLDLSVSTFYMLLFTGLFCYLPLLLRGNGVVQPIPDPGTALNLLLLCLVPTLCANLLLVKAIRHIGSTATSVLGCMEPLTAVMLGLIFLGEELQPLQYVGIAVIIAAVAWVIRSRGTQQPAADATDSSTENH